MQSVLAIYNRTMLWVCTWVLILAWLGSDMIDDLGAWLRKELGL